MAVIEPVVIFLSRFATQLIMAMLLFAPALKRRKYFWIRLIAGVTLYSIFPYALSGFGKYPLYRFEPIVFGWLNFTWAAVFAVGMIVFWFTFDVTVSETIFFGSAAYAIQHCARNSATLISNLFSIRGFWFYFTVMIVGWIVFALFYYIFARKIKQDDMSKIKTKSRLILSALIIAIVYVLSVYVGTEGERTIYSGKIYAVVCCVLMLILQFGMFDKSKKAREKEEIEKMLHSEQELHRISRENIELINIKCHDLKHQIATIRAMTNEEQRESSLKEIEKAVLIYDSVAKTGNDTIDLILSEKCLLCEKHNITFSYIADIHKIGFINELDLYSILGNAIDNAVEEAVNIKDPEKRIISLNIGMSGNLIRIHIENYIVNDIIFENGLPVTTKKDKKYHGYGIKSIKYITEKYKGHFNIYIHDNIFNLDILFPVTEEL